MTTHDPHADPTTDRLGEALRSLPRHRPRDGFTDRVLDHLERGDGAPKRPRALRLAAAALLAGAAVLGGLFVVDEPPQREKPRDEPRRARLEALEAERARLAVELAELRRLTDEIHREPAPVLYLGGDDQVDLVLDLGRLARDRGQGRARAGDDDYRFTAYDQEVDRP